MYLIFSIFLSAVVKSLKYGKDANLTVMVDPSKQLAFCWKTKMGVWQLKVERDFK